MVDGVELTSLRQRRSAAGDTFFTGRFGTAFVVLVRDEVERDLWRMIACDPSRANSRNDSAVRARAIGAPADNDGWYQSPLDDSMNDDVSDDWLASQQGSEGR